MPFAPANNANPKGAGGVANKNAKLQSELFLPHAQEAVNAVIKRLRSDDDFVALKAAAEVLNRVYGTPKASVEHSGNVNHNWIAVIRDKLPTIQ